MSTFIQRCVTALLGLWLAGSCMAHQLDETTARVTLRDGQVEVRILTDADEWREALSDPSNWLLGDIDQLYSDSMSAEQTQALLQSVLQQGSTLLVNAQPVELTVAALRQVTDEGHTQYSIQLLGQHSEVQVTQLGLTLPPSLGTVHLSVVRPQYRLMTAGETVSLTLAKQGL